jgi:hypothetical protein
MSFTSIVPTQVDLTQVNGIEEEEIEADPFDPAANATYLGAGHLDEDDDVTIVEQPSANSSAASMRGKRTGSSRIRDATPSGKKMERAGQKREHDGKVVEMMGRFLERKE